MTVLLLILKILLILLLIFLCLILYLLFSPFGLMLSFMSYEEMEGDFYIKSFLHFFQLRFVLTKKIRFLKVSIFWGMIPVFRKSFSEESNEEKVKEKKTRKKSKHKEAEEEKLKGKSSKSRRDKILTKIDYVMSNRGKRGIKKLLRAIKGIVKGLALHFYQTRISFGLSEPDKTGLLLGFLSMLPVIYDQQVSIQPDFQTDEAYFRGQMKVCGHIILCKVLIGVIPLLGDKDIKELFA